MYTLYTFSAYPAIRRPRIQNGIKVEEFWAHFRPCGPETGLSACIFFACGKKGYRFYPLREPKP
jgi:hypothetical protein